MQLIKRKGLLVLCVLAALILLTFPTLDAQESSVGYVEHHPMVAAQADLPPRLEVRPIQLLSGVFSTTAISGTLVFAGGKNELTVLDVSDPSEPAVRGKHALPCLPEDIVVDGVFVVVACYADPGPHIPTVLYIFELRHGTELIERARFVPASILRHFDVADGLLFVGLTDTLSIYDVSNLALRGTYPLAAADIDVVDDRAYLVNGMSLTILDVSDPAAPRLVGQTSVEGAAYVAATAEYAYVVTNFGDKYPSFRRAIVRVIDVRDPSAPMLSGRLDGFDYQLGDIEVANAHVFVHSAPYFTDGPNGVSIINVTDPAAPYIAGFYPTPSNEEDVALQRTNLVVVATDGGLHLFDATTSQPERLRVYQSFGHVQDVQVVGTTAYVISELWAGRGLTLVDVRNPLAPRVRGFIDLPSSYTGLQTSGFIVQGRYAYVPTSDRLYIVDISNPEQLSIVGRFDGGSTRIAVAETFAYLIDDTRLNVVDITDATSPQSVGSLPLTDGVDIKADGTNVYVLTPDDLVIVDARIPAPAERGRYSVAAERLEVVDDLVYVSGRAFQSVDVSNPEHPALHQNYGTWEGALSTYALEVSGNRAYVVVITNSILRPSLYVLEFQAQGTSIRRGMFDVFRSPGGLDVAGDQLYFTDGDFRIATLAEMDNAAYLPLIFQELR